MCKKKEVRCNATGSWQMAHFAEFRKKWGEGGMMSTEPGTEREEEEGGRSLWRSKR